MSTREITARALVTAGAVRSPAAGGSRTVLVAMTQAGHELIERTVDRVLRREAQLTRVLEPGQRAALAAGLDQLLAGLIARLAPGQVQAAEPSEPAEPKHVGKMPL